MSYSQPAERDAIAQQFNGQTRKLVNQTFRSLLSDEGVLTNKSMVGEKDVACEALIAACKRILKIHREELQAELSQLDVSPCALCTSYHQLANGLFEGGCNWGKLAMLFAASTLIAARICFDGNIELAESIKEWLIGFILGTHCKDWIIENDGWERFPDTYSPYKRQINAPTLLKVANRPRRPAAAVLRVSAAIGLGLSIFGSFNNPM